VSGIVGEATSRVGSALVVVNGIERELELEPDRSLLFVLREELGLTGAKPGCGEGVCGACTVLVDGKPVTACQAHISDIDGRAVTTVEGLATGGRLHPVQRAFLEVGALQCGYYTAGMIMRAVALLDQDADPDHAQVRAALTGNVCRCCTFPRILRAVRLATELARDADGAARPEPQAGNSDLTTANADLTAANSDLPTEAPTSRSPRRSPTRSSRRPGCGCARCRWCRTA
jgi:aerobic-type carbon monoxide dehydrogenase small subunit (CoxS/CutS family)